MGICRNLHLTEIVRAEKIMSSRSSGITKTFPLIHRYGQFVDKLMQLAGELEIKV
jgi:hypothetical protein